ncbi:MAG: phospholipase D-like domain-containing protein [Acidobacteriia bacterium]|nr:phospholipase D-like domain-containing protein [Terriglobia bacterium]
MNLIIEPDDGAAPLLAAIKKAKKSVEIAIFRFDRGDIEAALKAAASKGVKVTALIAWANRDGEEHLRRLETRFLEAGIIVARSGDDLVRYHDKLTIIDRSTLYLLSFNFTHLDIEHSRGFGIVTKNAKWVQEAVKLFEADCTRSPYTAGVDTFVVSPVNSRRVLSEFLVQAKKQLLIYDPKVSDKEMIRVLEERQKAGVEIRIIGKVSPRAHFPSQKLSRARLHTRTIIRDRRQAFVGSQSLRPMELDMRREVGLIVREPKIVKRLIDLFEKDWDPGSDGAGSVRTKADLLAPLSRDSQLAVQVLEKELHPIAVQVKDVVKKVVAQAGEEVLEDRTVKNTVKRVVKKAVKQAVEEVISETAQETKKS